MTAEFAQRIANLMGRSVSSIYQRRALLGLKDQESWTPEEDEYLRTNRTLTARAASQVLKRTLEAIKRRKMALGIAKSAVKPWTAEEDAYLRQNSAKPSEEIARKLGRNLQAVKARRAHVGITKKLVRWTDSDDAYIRKHADQTNEEIGGKLGRTPLAVDTHRRSLGLPALTRPVWTEAEDEFIRANPTMSPRKIAAKLGRSESAVNSHRAKMKLPRIKVRDYDREKRERTEAECREWVQTKGYPNKHGGPDELRVCRNLLKCMKRSPTFAAEMESYRPRVGRPKKAA